MVESLLEDAPSRAQPPVTLPSHDVVVSRSRAGLCVDSVLPVPTGRRIALNLRFDSDWPALAGALVLGMATGFLVGWMLANRD